MRDGGKLSDFVIDIKSKGPAADFDFEVTYPGTHHVQFNATDLYFDGVADYLTKDGKIQKIKVSGDLNIQMMFFLKHKSWEKLTSYTFDKSSIVIDSAVPKADHFRIRLQVEKIVTAGILKRIERRYYIDELTTNDGALSNKFFPKTIINRSP